MFVHFFSRADRLRHFGESQSTTLAQVSIRSILRQAHLAAEFIRGQKKGNIAAGTSFYMEIVNNQLS